MEDILPRNTVGSVNPRDDDDYSEGAGFINYMNEREEQDIKDIKLLLAAALFGLKDPIHQKSVEGACKRLGIIYQG